MSELPDDVRSLFGGANYAHLATLLPDGAPHSVPVWVDVEGDRVALLTSENSRKGRNLARDPEVMGDQVLGPVDRVLTAVVLVVVAISVAALGILTVL